MELILGPEKYSTLFKFEIPEGVQRIGIAVSGGLDSAILLCVILSELRDTNRLNSTTVKCYTFIKTDGSTFYADRIIEQVNGIYGVSLCHENNIPNNISHGRVDLSAARAVYRRKETELFYWGINKQVDKSIKEFNNNLIIDYGSSEEWENSTFNKAPFLNMKKPNMVDLYYKLGVENLIQYTHTCTKLRRRRCMNCYSCEERAWAFLELNKPDKDFVCPDIDVSFGETHILVK